MTWPSRTKPWAVDTCAGVTLRRSASRDQNLWIHAFHGSQKHSWNFFMALCSYKVFSFPRWSPYLINITVSLFFPKTGVRRIMKFLRRNCAKRCPMAHTGLTTSNLDCVSPWPGNVWASRFDKIQQYSRRNFCSWVSKNADRATACLRLSNCLQAYRYKIFFRL